MDHSPLFSVLRAARFSRPAPLQAPAPHSPHYTFYMHLLNGGAVVHCDPLTGEPGELTLHSLAGNAANIRYYAHTALTIARQPAPVGAAAEAQFPAIGRRGVRTTAPDRTLHEAHKG